MFRIPIASMLTMLLTSACSVASPTDYPAAVNDQEVRSLVEDRTLSEEADDHRPASPANAEAREQTVDRLDGVSQSHGGVTVRVDQVTYSPHETAIDLVVLADREYGFGWDEELPPQYSYLLNGFQLVDDHGRLVRNTTGEYGFARSDPSGNVAFDHHYRFGTPTADATELTLQFSSVILGNLYARDIMEFSLDGLSVGDEWEVHQPVVFGPLFVVFDRVRLAEGTGQLHSFRLEADRSAGASEFMGASVRATCIRMYPVVNPSFRRLQDSNCSETGLISYIEFGSAGVLNPSLPTQPLKLRAVTDLVVDGPWTISWPIEN